MSVTHSVAAALLIGVLTPALGFAEPPQGAAPGAVAPGAVAPAPVGERQSGSARLESLEAQLAQRPNDLKLLKRYEDEAASQLNEMLYLRARRDPAVERPARLLAERVRRLLDGLRPTDAAAKQAVAEAAETVDYFRRSIDARQQTFEQLRRRLDADPNDAEAVLVYEIKVQSEHHPFNEPEATRAQLADDKAFLAALKDKAPAGKVRETVEVLLARTVPRLEKQVAASLALREALLDRDAPPLAEVQAWVNGGPLSAEQLKGKVVLLEFWAVWCGPCVRLFPELRRWHDAYSDRGLTIVGVTGLWDYAWDDATGEPVQSDGDVTPARELQMLEKFVSRHELPYPIAVENGRSLSAAYRVDAVPRTVLIDRRGKVRLIHVGALQSGQVEDMIAKLLAETPE